METMATIEHIIKVDEVLTLARSISTNIDKKDVEIFIDESEQIDIKNAIGEELFLSILDGKDCKQLLDGGVYTDKDGKKRMFKGLKKALAYYVYARLVKQGSGKQTSYGYMEKNAEFSSHVGAKERMQAYNDVFTVADRYMSECIRYIQNDNILFPGNTKKCRVRSRKTIRAIGE